MKLASAVVFYNPTKDDIKNIDSYIDDVDILYIIDNSESSYINKVKKNNKIKYIFNNENLGISKALNNAAKLAQKDGYKWMLTLDQDTKFNKDVLKELKKYCESVDYSKVGIITPWHKTKLKLDKPNKKIDYPLDVMTSGNLLNLSIHKKLNGFDEDLFIDGVDIEYCLKLRKNNYVIDRLNYLEIDHNLGNIFYKRFLNKDILVTNHSAVRRYYQVRNYHYIKDKYLNVDKDFCKRLIKFKSVIFAIIFYDKKDKINKLKACIKGYIDYKKGKVGKTYGNK